MQAATGLENLKMGESPNKVVNSEAVGKENIVHNILVPSKDKDGLKKHAQEMDKKGEQKPNVASDIKLEEAIEPLLQENPNRFVLFPLKYHEVRVDASRVYCLRVNEATDLANVQESRSLLLDS